MSLSNDTHQAIEYLLNDISFLFRFKVFFHIFFNFLIFTFSRFIIIIIQTFFLLVDACSLRGFAIQAMHHFSPHTLFVSLARLRSFSRCIGCTKWKLCEHFFLPKHTHREYTNWNRNKGNGKLNQIKEYHQSVHGKMDIHTISF